MASRPRYTRTDVRSMFSGFLLASRDAGIDTTGWHLKQGSAVHGIAYRVLDADNSTVLYLDSSTSVAALMLAATTNGLRLAARARTTA